MDVGVDVGDCKLVCGVLQQVDVQVGFQLVDMVVQVGFGDVQCVFGCGKVFVVYYYCEVVEIVEVVYFEVLDLE